MDLKAPIWKIIFLFLFVLITLTVYSFSEKEIKIGNIILEKTNIKQILSDTFLNDSILNKDTILFVKTDTIIKKEAVRELDTLSQRILLIGDSMLEGLMLRMRDYCGFNKHFLKSVIWYSSQTKWYGSCDTLTFFIKKYKPTYVFLVLGANELFVSNIIEKRDKYVKNILSQVNKDSLKFVWIGPPNWKEDTGINNLIQNYLDSTQFFFSKELSLNNSNFKRYKDGAHPKKASSAMWMDSIASWVMKTSKYPIILSKPSCKIKGSPNVTLLQPKK